MYNVSVSPYLNKPDSDPREATDELGWSALWDPIRDTPDSTDRSPGIPQGRPADHPTETSARKEPGSPTDRKPLARSHGSGDHRNRFKPEPLPTLWQTEDRSAIRYGTIAAYQVHQVAPHSLGNAVEHRMS